jgi:uncharacterized protein
MDPRLHFLTLATRDLDAARRFYRDGLGWQPLIDVPDEILFFQVGPGLLLGLFEADKFAADNGGALPAGIGGTVLSHNVPTADAVQTTVDALVAAGGELVKPVADSAFGGVRHGMVRDPNGVVWEIGFNPFWSIADDGTVALSAPE